MKCPTCNSTVPVCELCEGCRRQIEQITESTQAQLKAAQAELQSLRKMLVSAQDIAAEALGKQNEARGEIQSLQNRLGQKHVEIEQLKNTLASAVETAQSKDHAKQQSIIYAKETTIRNLETALKAARQSARESKSFAEGTIIGARNARERVQDLETKLKAADQAYVAMVAVAQGNLDTARKERDEARKECQGLQERNRNQYNLIFALQAKENDQPHGASVLQRIQNLERRVDRIDLEGFLQQYPVRR